MSLNTPYIKKYNKKGVCTNPITKNKPYLFFELNRSQKKAEQKKIQI